MSRSRKKVAAHGMCGGVDTLWKRQERQRLRRANRVRVQTGREPLVKHENGIHDWWSSPSDGRVIYHIPPNPNIADPDEIRWYRRSLRK